MIIEAVEGDWDREDAGPGSSNLRVQLALLLTHRADTARLLIDPYYMTVRIRRLVIVVTLQVLKTERDCSLGLPNKTKRTLKHKPPLCQRC